MPRPLTHIAVVGDTHGHLQLGLCVMARWQKLLGVRLEALFLCGDVGTFTNSDQLDNATRLHAKDNPVELEFLHQWSVDPQPNWLSHIFDSSGLDLECPVIMVHGNHEGFAHLERLARGRGRKDDCVEIDDLPFVDSGEHIRYLPSGWRVKLPSGYVAGGVGGMEAGQRRAKYHPMAYIDENSVLQLLDNAAKIDILITHQGPSGVQADRGAPSLQPLLDREVARVWFHGHSARHPEVAWCGPTQSTCLAPLGDAAFCGTAMDDPGQDAYAVLSIDERCVRVKKEPPPFLRDFRFKYWTATRDGLWVCPDLQKCER